jgi:hypothetical protein
MAELMELKVGGIAPTLPVEDGGGTTDDRKYRLGTRAAIILGGAVGTWACLAAAASWAVTRILG